MRPNIVLFVADQMRADSLHHLGCEPSLTPNFDSLVEEDAISFRNAYCQNPVCVPSRNSFLSGLYPHTTGHRTMHYLSKKFEPNILKEMKSEGYEVIWIGRNDLIPADESKEDYCDYYFGNNREMKNKSEEPSVDYSFYIGPVKNSNNFLDFDKECIKEALDYLDHRDSKKPFLLYISLIFPHPPYVVEEEYFNKIHNVEKWIRRTDIKNTSNKSKMLAKISEKQNLSNKFNEEDWNNLRKTYLAMVCRVDYHFSLISNKLKEKKLYDNTGILIFSDHGDYTGDYGIVEKAQNSFEDSLTNVPLILKPPRTYDFKPRISDSLVELNDISATIAELANFDLSYSQFGVSILSLLKEDNEIHKFVVCEGGRNYGEVQAMEIGHDENSPYWPRLSTQCEENGAHNKGIMLRYKDKKYIYRIDGMDELYDLKDDPYEIKNIILNPYYKDEVEQMKLDLLDFMVRTADFVPNKKDKR